MPLNDFIDNAIRKSFIGVRLSEFRSSNPALYKRLRSIYETVMSFRSKNGLARYQLKALNNFYKYAPQVMLNNTVLEIGSDLDAKVIKELKSTGCREVIGINPEFDESNLEEINKQLPKGCVLKKWDIRSTCLPDNTIGAIFSVSVFEHLLEFDLCLSEMHRLLIRGGFVFAEFGPIWSSSLGHHVHATVHKEEARHWDPTKNPVPNYAHLLLDKHKLIKHLKGSVSDNLAAEIVAWIYEKPYINRLFLEDYIRLIKGSDFEIVNMEFDREHVPSDKLKQLISKYPQYNIFDVRNIHVVLRKKSFESL
jgi:hypothetical protein